jgi:Flp pilus assembly protein TadD
MNPRILLSLLLVGGCAVPGDPAHPDRLDEMLAPAEQSADSGEAPSKALLDRLDQILKENGNHHRSLLLRSRLLLSLHRSREALRDLNRLVELYPPEPETASLRGRAFYDLGLHREARAAFRQSLDLDGRHAPGMVGLGLLLADAGAFPEAARYFERAHEIDPSNLRTQALLGAARALHPSIEGAKALSDPLERELAGRVLLGSGQLQAGTTLLLTLLRERPDDPHVLKASASGLSRQGHDRAAERLLAHATAIDPSDPEAAFALAGVTARLSTADASLLPRASRQFEQAAALVPRDPRPLLAAAGLHARSGGLADASRCFKAAETADPSDPSVPVDYGLFLVRSGNPGDGIAVYRRGLQRHPQHALLQANLMAALYEFGRSEEAEEIRTRLAARTDLDARASAVLQAYSGANNP